MWKKKIALVTALTLVTAPAWSYEAYQDFDYAKVKSVTPRYERVNMPREECWTERVPGGYRETRGPDNYWGPIIGGIAGGLLGSTVGKGSGKHVAIGAGAVAGTIVGAQLSRNEAYAYEPPHDVQRCRVVDRWEKRIADYEVTYQYAGRTYTTVLPYDPGPRLRVRVSVEPAE